MVTSSRIFGKAQAVILACMLALPIALWLSPAALAQQTSTGTQTTVQTTAKPYAAEVSKYAAKRYFVAGPLQVIAASADSIRLFTGARPLHVDMKGTKVTVKDVNNQSISMGAVSPGDTVYVCRGKTEAVIFLVAKGQTGPRTPPTVVSGERGVTRGAH
ncbi:MAG: hypothetical protein AB1664_02700 [Thermodesulfobacteriota bacterium]